MNKRVSKRLTFNSNIEEKMIKKKKTLASEASRRPTETLRDAGISHKNWLTTCNNNLLSSYVFHMVGAGWQIKAFLYEENLPTLAKFCKNVHEVYHVHVRKCVLV